MGGYIESNKKYRVKEISDNLDYVVCGELLVSTLGIGYIMHNSNLSDAFVKASSYGIINVLKSSVVLFGVSTL